MQSLVLTPIDDHALYADVSAAASEQEEADRLLELAPKVIDAYKRYLGAGEDVTGLTPMPCTGLDPDRLKNNYSPRLGYAEFRPVSGVLKREGTTCPYCNCMDVGELDHYLPQSVFPEYSILTGNLVPICSKCNKRKLNRYKRSSGSGGPMFLHPYRHAFTDFEFLSVHLNFGETIIASFSVERPEGMDEDLWLTVKSHFQTLKLADRYKLRATSRMLEIRSAVRAYYQRGGSAAVKDYLQIDADSLVHEYGPNHWQARLQIELSASKEFCSGGFALLGVPKPEI